jgi:hypothetical protein
MKGRPIFVGKRESTTAGGTISMESDIFDREYDRS